MKPAIYSYPLVLALIVLSACAPYGPPQAASSTGISSPSPTWPPPTSTVVLQITQTPSPMPLPTLEPEQGKTEIRKLLKESGDCKVPCFWGITPGQTTIGEAEGVFRHLGLPFESTNYEGKQFFGSKYQFDSGLSIIPTLTVQNMLVTNLRVDITPETQKADLPREWLTYSPEMLIGRYGFPSSVDFKLDWGPRSFFEMDLYFDQINLIVEYAGQDIIPRQKGPARVCPLNDQYEIVRVWMGTDPVYPPPANGIPLEKATTMNLKEFSELMSRSPDQACFWINGNAFP